MVTTRSSHHMRVTPSVVYRALVDAMAVSRWRATAGMRSEADSFEARAGSARRVSLTYDRPTVTEKSAAQTDTYHGHFVKLVPDTHVVEVHEFETDSPARRGETTSMATLTEVDGGTDVLIAHEGIPMALEQLAALVEGRGSLR